MPANGGPDKMELRVRMYRVGFGDCFLISLPTAAGYRHILVDCGVHAKGDIHTMEKIIGNIASETNKSLAIVIATHAHQDHISGFAKGGETFKKFAVDEVWLPWTENPNDKQASKLHNKRIALAEQLAQHFAARGASPAALEAVANLAGNQLALQLLHSGFGTNAQVRYLEVGNELKDPAKIAGLSVRVLGPPRDPESLAKMDPPASQRYFRLGPDGEEKTVNDLLPFTSKWHFTRNADALKQIRLSLQEEKHLQKELADPSLDDLAFALDQAMNNTSLVTLLTFHGQHLLFPGDAQYGNWRWWLEHEQADQILSQVSFYKVSHHGSLNATPRGALEKMSTGQFAAMVSTQSTPWPSIPRPGLMKALTQQTAGKVVRSDWLPIPQAPKPSKAPAPSHLPQGFSKGPFWYDYLVKL